MAARFPMVIGWDGLLPKMYSMMFAANCGGVALLERETAAGAGQEMNRPHQYQGRRESALVAWAFSASVRARALAVPLATGIVTSEV
jgi:hypothetical protein